MVFVSWVSLNVMKVRFLAYNFNEKKEKIINLTKPIEFEDNVYCDVNQSQAFLFFLG
jgi:hypothetical protein